MVLSKITDPAVPPPEKPDALEPFELVATCKEHGLPTKLIVPLPIIFTVTNVEGDDDPCVVWQEAYTEESTQWRLTTECDCLLPEVMLPELIAEAFRMNLSECDGEVVAILYDNPEPLFRSPTAILRGVSKSWT
jgi:hypothetical protein